MAGEPLHNLPKMLVLVVLARRVVLVLVVLVLVVLARKVVLVLVVLARRVILVLVVLARRVVLVLVVLARRVVPRVVRWWRAPVLRPSARQDGWSAPPRESSHLRTFLSLLSSAAPEKDEIMFMSKTRRWVIISQQRAHFWLWSVSTGG